MSLFNSTSFQYNRTAVTQKMIEFKTVPCFDYVIQIKSFLSLHHTSMTRVSGHAKLFPVINSFMDICLSKLDIGLAFN